MSLMDTQEFGSTQLHSIGIINMEHYIADFNNWLISSS